MKICFLCSEYPPGPHGGIGTLTQTLARGLVEAGHTVRVVGIYAGSYPAPDFEVDRGVKVWRLRESRHPLGWVRDRWKLYRMIARWALQRAIDIVEVPDWEGSAAGWPRLPVPVVARLSGSAAYFASEMGKRPPRSLFLLENASIHRADFWFSESNYVARKTRVVFGLASDPDAIIYNPVELPARAGDFAKRSRTKVVFAGTLTKKKGILSIIEAWPLVRSACGDAELHIWGKDEGPGDRHTMRDRLLSRMDGSLKGTVFFHGHVPLNELLEVFQTARVAVFPSYAEGFALVPMHAMAAGCPTIYTLRGSGPELITSGRDGLLVDPDRPAMIAQAIIDVLRNDALAERLGKSGRERIIGAFALETLVARNVELYQECGERFLRRTRAVPEKREPVVFTEPRVEQ